MRYKATDILSSPYRTTRDVSMYYDCNLAYGCAAYSALRKFLDWHTGFAKADPTAFLSPPALEAGLNARTPSRCWGCDNRAMFWFRAILMQYKHARMLCVVDMAYTEANTLGVTRECNRLVLGLAKEISILWLKMASYTSWNTDDTSSNPTYPHFSISAVG